MWLYLQEEYRWPCDEDCREVSDEVVSLSSWLWDFRTEHWWRIEDFPNLHCNLLLKKKQAQDSPSNFSFLLHGILESGVNKHKLDKVTFHGFVTFRRGDLYSHYLLTIIQPKFSLRMQITYMLLKYAKTSLQIITYGATTEVTKKFKGWKLLGSLNCSLILGERNAWNFKIFNHHK